MDEINQGENIKETIKRTKDRALGSTNFVKEWQMNKSARRSLRNNGQKGQHLAKYSASEVKVGKNCKMARESAASENTSGSSISRVEKL